MEVIRGVLHQAFAMGDSSGVGAARRHAALLAQAAGFDEVLAGRLALVVTELGGNLIRHARNGNLLLAVRDDAGEVEVLSVDQGPGMANVAQNMADGFSTGGTPGTGLGAVRRLADDFDIHSSVPAGTCIVARVRRPGAAVRNESIFRIGAVALAAPGESVSGDGWAVALDGQRAAMLMADGLGHGTGAEEAALAALRLFAQQPFEDASAALERAHAVLRSTRGAAVSKALLDAGTSSLRTAGAGNVMTRVVSGISDRTLLSQNGTIGVQVRRTEEVTSDWPRHSAVVMHTDGIMARWQANVIASALTRDPSLAAAILWRDYCRGRDDATVLVVRRKE